MGLDELERYYDAVPRRGADAEDFGALTLFVRRGEGWPFYARPARSTSPATIMVGDVDRVRARQRELGVPEAFEWVYETTPSMHAAIDASGLQVHEHPLMVLDPGAPPVTAIINIAAIKDNVVVRILGADDPALPSALAVGHLAFADAGTAIGAAGLAELAAAVEAHADNGAVERMAERIRAGSTTIVAAVTAHHQALCAGWHQPVDGVTEIVGVGTLPAARRAGLALAVTAALVADARRAGIGTVFLSAGDDDVARIYTRIGFRQVGTAAIAEV